MFAKNEADLQREWAEMEAVKELRLVRSIGFSNLERQKIETIFQTAKTPSAINQIELQLYFQRTELASWLQQHNSPEAGGQDPAATSLSMQSEDDRAQAARSHLNKTLDILENHKQSFITDIESEVEEYFEDLDVRTCLQLVEINETQHNDGTVTAQRLDSHPFSIDVVFWTHLCAFMQQRVANQQQAPVRNFIDWAHTESVVELVQRRFDRLCQQQSDDAAACYLKLHLEVTSKRDQLCHHARERLRWSETPLSTTQLADVSSLDDEEILNDVLRLDSKNKSRGANYMRAMIFVRKRLPQPRFEWQTEPLDPHATTRPGLRRGAGDPDASSRVERSNLNSITRSIVTNHFILFLAEVLGVTTADNSSILLPQPTILRKLNSLLEVFSVTTALGGRISAALATDLRNSFANQTEELWKDFVLREDAILEPLVEMLISPADRARIVNQVIDVSPCARKVLAIRKHAKVKRCIEEEFHSISSGRYSWLKELQKLRISDDDMAQLLLDEHDACPWVFYMETKGDEVQTSEVPLFDDHLNGCAHSLLETGEKGLGSRLRAAAISNASSSASFQDIEIMTKLHKICGLAGFRPTSRKKETWEEVVVCDKEEVATARIYVENRYPPDILKSTIAILKDMVDTWGPAELLCASSDQGPFAMRIGGGILYTEDDHENQYHWSESVDLDKVSQREIDLVGKLLIGAVHVNSGCQSDYGALRRRTRLQTLGTQEQSHRLVFETFGFSLAQLFSVVVQASVKHSAGVSHKKADRDTAQHHVMSLLDYRSAVQVSYCTGICQRVRFRDMVADLLCEFRPERVHSVADATAWRQLLATDIVGRLKGDGDVILDDPVHQELLKVKVKDMYGYLFHSGINDDGTLRVAWPSLGDRHAYCPVHCSGTNAWTNLLSESTHISSYAYMAPQCLQADRGSPCQGGWEPATGLSQVRAFATRVQCVNAVKCVAALPHESICFFQLMRIIVFAQVHHPDGEPVLLRVILHTVRASVVRRLIAIWHRTGTTMTQVQESRDGATRAEEVLIVCGWDP
ncbi:hypothetical protein MY8738_007024 [Beauveria namnaoensis]